MRDLRRVIALLILLMATSPVALLLLAGCPDSGGAVAPPTEAGGDAITSACAAGYLGDPKADPMIELRALKVDGTDVPINDGDDLAIIFPPQGGRVAFVGVRALNVDGCGMQITGVLRDLTTKQVRLDGRTVNLRREDDGWGTTGKGTSSDVTDSAEIGDYSNVPLCPNSWASQNIYDVPYELEVLIVDRSQKTISKKITVTPRCAEPGERFTACECLCKKDYKLGESCGEDAGLDSGGGN